MMFKKQLFNTPVIIIVNEDSGKNGIRYITLCYLKERQKQGYQNLFQVAKVPLSRIVHSCVPGSFVCCCERTRKNANVIICLDNNDCIVSPNSDLCTLDHQVYDKKFLKSKAFNQLINC